MKLILNPGDVICPECKGAVVNDKLGNGLPIVACSVCHGEGKLDWIENIVGKSCQFLENDLTHFISKQPNGQIEGQLYWDENINLLKIYVEGEWSDV